MEQKIIKYVKEYDLSDIHVRADNPFAIRVHGEIKAFPEEPISEEDIQKFLKTVLTPDEIAKFESTLDLDSGFTIDEVRYRGNFYKTTAGSAFVLRKINPTIPNISDLNLPPIVKDIIRAPNGLVLVTGPTGSGKSTSLGAINNEINGSRNGHIITIEDPVEFIHTPRSCIISQREVGRDTKSFASGLRAALREDPDVILLGEMRDQETIALALTAAETGHLVFGTLHTNGAVNSVNRIIDVFPADQHDQVRSQLAESLQMVMTQQLLPTLDGEGRIGAFEVMTCNKAVRNLIRENKIHQIPNIMSTASSDGMITMEKALQGVMGKARVAF